MHLWYPNLIFIILYCAKYNLLGAASRMSAYMMRDVLLIPFFLLSCPGSVQLTQRSDRKQVELAGPLYLCSNVEHSLRHLLTHTLIVFCIPDCSGCVLCLFFLLLYWPFHWPQRPKFKISQSTTRIHPSITPHPRPVGPLSVTLMQQEVIST